MKIVDGKRSVHKVIEKPLATNTLYAGIENRLNIEVEGVKSDDRNYV